MPNEVECSLKKVINEASSDHFSVLKKNDKNRGLCIERFITVAYTVEKVLCINHTEILRH